MTTWAFFSFQVLVMGSPTKALLAWRNVFFSIIYFWAFWHLKKMRIAQRFSHPSHIQEIQCSFDAFSCMKTSQAYEEKKPKMKKQKKKRLTWTKEMQARYSQEGRPYIFHLGGDTLKLQAFPCEQLWCHLVASFFRCHPMFPI